jgi:hypothetical protein
MPVRRVAEPEALTEEQLGAGRVLIHSQRGTYRIEHDGFTWTSTAPDGTVVLRRINNLRRQRAAVVYHAIQASYYRLPTGSLWPHRQVPSYRWPQRQRGAITSAPVITVSGPLISMEYSFDVLHGACSACGSADVSEGVCWDCGFVRAELQEQVLGRRVSR